MIRPCTEDNFILFLNISLFFYRNIIMDRYGIIRLFKITIGICRAIMMAVTFVTVLLLACAIPHLKAIVLKRIKILLGQSKMKPEDVLKSLYSFQVLKSEWDHWIEDAFKTAWCGYPAPNGPVLTQDGATSLQLLDAMKPGRPLVINFGSCT